MPIRDLKDQITVSPSSRGSTCTSTRRVRPSMSGGPGCCATGCAATSGAYGSSPKTDALLDDVTRLEVVVTDSLVEALALENNLIKQRVAPLQHPAPRRQELPLPAAHDDRGVPPGPGGAPGGAGRGLLCRSVSCPATFARKTMSLTHKLFGIRSCNEVITGKRGRPCLEYDIKRCIAPCVDEICSREEYARRWTGPGSSWRAGTTSCWPTSGPRCRPRRTRCATSSAAQIRDTIRTVETLRDRKQKMATARLGERDAFGVKVGAAGAVVQVFQVAGRPRRRAGRAGQRRGRRRRPHARGPGARGGPAVLRGAGGADRGAPARSSSTIRREIERWLSERSTHRVKVRHVPKRGDARGLVDLASRNAGVAYAARHGADAQAVDEPRSSELRTARSVCLVDRPASSASTSPPSRGRRPSRRWWSPRTAACCGASTASSAFKGLRGTTPSRPDDFAAMEEVVLRRYRRLLEQGGPFPGSGDRRRWGRAGLVRLQGARAARTLESRRRGHRQEGGAARDPGPRDPDRAPSTAAPRCAWCSGYATRPTGWRSRSIDAPAPSATCAPSSTTWPVWGRSDVGRCSSGSVVPPASGARRWPTRSSFRWSARGPPAPSSSTSTARGPRAELHGTLLD